MTAAEKFVVWSLLSAPPESCDQTSVKHRGRFLSAEGHQEVTVAVLVWNNQPVCLPVSSSETLGRQRWSSWFSAGSAPAHLQ